MNLKKLLDNLPNLVIESLRSDTKGFKRRDSELLEFGVCMDSQGFLRNSIITVGYLDVNELTKDCQLKKYLTWMG